MNGYVFKEEKLTSYYNDWNNYFKCDKIHLWY